MPSHALRQTQEQRTSEAPTFRRMTTLSIDEPADHTEVPGGWSSATRSREDGTHVFGARKSLSPALTPPSTAPQTLPTAEPGGAQKALWDVRAE